MTCEEAAELLVYDRVWTTMPWSRDRVMVTVVSIAAPFFTAFRVQHTSDICRDCGLCLDVFLRFSRSDNGRMTRIHHQYLDSIANDVDANIYADYLEEEGYFEASKVLRAKFPLIGIG